MCNIKRNVRNEAFSKYFSNAKCSDHIDRCHDLSLSVLYGIR